MEKLKRKKNKSEKEVSEVKEKSEIKKKKSVALSKEEKEEKKAKKAKSTSEGTEKSIKAAEKASNDKEKKAISWNPFSKDNMYALKVWFQGLKSEWKKIIWPTKPQIFAYTVVVLATLISVSIYLFVLGKIFEFIFKRFGIV